MEPCSFDRSRKLDLGFSMNLGCLNQILPGTGRGTMRSMVVGQVRRCVTSQAADCIGVAEAAGEGAGEPVEET